MQHRFILIGENGDLKILNSQSGLENHLNFGNQSRE
jgi:hypothetical protein